MVNDADHVSVTFIRRAVSGLAAKSATDVGKWGKRQRINLNGTNPSGLSNQSVAANFFNKVLVSYLRLAPILMGRVSRFSLHGSVMAASPILLMAPAIPRLHLVQSVTFGRCC